MKTDVEELTPTRVKLTIEVPFEELKPSLDKAYKALSQQVRLKGFRPGKVPARLIDQYVGRGAVLQEAVNDALPELYGRAVEETELFVLGQPDVEITNLDDGNELAFTAEVDIRPKFDLPDYEGLEVTVEDAVVTPDEVEEAIDNLRERFAQLKSTDRAVERGDFVSIDLSAKIGEDAVEDARTSGYSYEVGSESSVDGLDEALVGLNAGDVKTFTSTLVAGERSGEEAEVTVTAQSVKVKEVPELDDDFAQLASEFDTIGELRADLRKRLERNKRLQQVVSARDKALEALLDQIDIPLPESVIESEIARRNEQLDEQLRYAGLTKDDYLDSQEKAAEEFDTEIADAARLAVKGGFVLDQLALQEELAVENDELSEYVMTQAMQLGLQPQELAQRLTESGRIPALASEMLRTKSLNVLLEHVKIKDESGTELDLETLRGESDGEPEAGLEADQEAQATEPVTDEAVTDEAVTDEAAAELEPGPADRAESEGKAEAGEKEPEA